MTLPGNSLTGSELIDEKLFPAKGLDAFAFVVRREERSGQVLGYREVARAASFTGACRPAS